jgi:hypothetical protein
MVGAGGKSASRLVIERETDAYQAAPNNGPWEVCLGTGFLFLEILRGKSTISVTKIIPLLYIN